MTTRNATAPSGELGAAQRNRRRFKPQGSTDAPDSQHDFVGAAEMGLAPRLPVGDFETLDIETARRGY